MDLSFKRMNDSSSYVFPFNVLNFCSLVAHVFHLHKLHPFFQMTANLHSDLPPTIKQPINILHFFYYLSISLRCMERNLLLLLF